MNTSTPKRKPFFGRSAVAVEFPTVSISREGSRELWGLPEDDLAASKPDAVDQVGQAVTLLLAILGREPVY